MRGVIDDTRLANIAAAIREKTGAEKTYTPEEMASGVNEVYEAGKKSEYDEFWDNLQNNGNYPTASSYSFCGSSWNDVTFNPKYDITTGYDGQVFLFAYSLITDLRGILERNEVKLIFRGGNFTNTFYNSKITRLPEMYIDAKAQYGIFAVCKDLKSIQKIILPDKNPNYMSGAEMFRSCTSLEEIEFEGVLYDSISFSYSPLSVASLKSIITHLKDYSGTTSEYTYTLTLKSDCWTALDAEGATAPGGMTWRDYITALGWNMA